MKNLFYLSLVTLISISLNAQTGPGGVGNATTNVIWLNGDIVTFSTVPNIGTWPDQSGNGNDFNQATATKQPRTATYVGFTSIRFDGGDFVRSGGIAALNTSNNSQFIVYNGFKPNHIGVLFDASFTESNQFLRTYRNNGNLKSWVLNNALGVVQNTTTNSSAFQIISSIWDGGSQTFESYKDGALIGSQVGANGSPTGNVNNTVGGASNGAYRFDGDMGEVIMYNTVLNSAERNIVDNYLSSKFSIPTATDLYAYDVVHRYQVFGIGQEASGNNLVAQGIGVVEITGAGLSNGDYILSGHDNASLSQITSDIPAALGTGSRITRTWRAGVTGTPGVVSIDVDVSGLPLSAGAYYLIVESVNGIFNDGGTVEYGPVVDVAGIATFAGVSLADGDYYSIGTSNGSAIVSVTTGFWDVGSTWNCNCVPGAGDDVTITNGHTVTARTTTNVNNLIIDGNLNTQQTGAFNVKGNYTVNATGTIIHKTITFNGTAQQDITNNSATTVDFSTLVVNNASNVTYQSGNFSISNSLNVSNGQLQVIGGTCTFLSTALKTAVIVNGTGGFSGNFIVQRHVSTRNASWGDLSSPVTAATLGSWDSDQTGTVTELFMSDVNGIDGSAGGFNSAYRWDAPTQVYVTVTDTTYALVPGAGTEIWMGDDFTTWNAKTFDTHGTPNSGNVAVGVLTDWNLVGNPYQAFIDWALLTRPTLNSTYYIWNTNNASYDAHTAGNIPPHQGFWVESVGAGTLTFTESSKIGSGSSVFYKTSTEPYVFEEALLKIKSNTLSYSHTLKLRLNNLAEIGNDDFDATFKSSRIQESMSITSYSSDSNRELAINSFNYQEEVIIPVAVSVGVSGEYIIEPQNFEAFENEFDFIELKDNVTGKIYDLSYDTKGEITFEMEKGDDLERFTLRLSNLMSESLVAVEDNINIYKNNENTIIEFEHPIGNYEISVYNSIGQKVLENIFTSGENNVVISNDKMPHGINIITVKSSQDIIVKKINY